MRSIVLYIAASIDQYIATTDHQVDWLEKAAKEGQTDHGYGDFLETVDTLLMGRKTYQAILDMDVPWPYNNQRTFVFSRNKALRAPTPNTTYIHEEVEDKLRELKEQPGKDIWLVGGGYLLGTCLDAGLIDRMMLFYAPVMLGQGVPLFPERKKTPIEEWTLTRTEQYESGFILCQYESKTPSS